MKLERLLFTIAVLMLLLPLAAQEKEQSGMRFLDHLTLGGEIGTMGIGLEVATPLHPNIRLRAGIVALPFALRETYDLAIDAVSEKGNSYAYMVGRDERIVRDLQEERLPLKDSDFPRTVSAVEKLRRIEGKVLVDFYPRRDGCFYVTLGAYVGGMNQRRVQADVGPYVRAVEIANGYLPEDDQMQLWLSTTTSTWSNYIYRVEVGKNKETGYNLRILPVKPYVGIGFGRMLPKRKLGCYFDMGILYRDRWRLNHDGECIERWKSPYKWSAIYGMAALRLTGQLF